MPEVETKRRFDTRDFNTIAEFVKNEFDDRKKRRKHLEKVWKEIDRQIRMEPDLSARIDPNTRKIRAGAEWMPALELPLQAQTLEVLTADARRMLFPDSGSFFAAHAALTDKYLSRVDYQSLVSGDENEVPSLITQDNADKLVEGWLNHFHAQYDFRGHWDAMDAEAFKYGTLLGRARIVTKEVFRDTARGLIKDSQRFPVLFPVSIRNTYLDDSKHHLMHEGFMVGPSVIREVYRKLEDVQLAAQKGSADPNSESGGWMPAQIKGLEANEDGNVQVLEFEGDLVIPRKTTRSVFVPNVIVTVVVGKDCKVARLRFNKFPFPTYLSHPYHAEDTDSAYGVGPLMKGMPVQMAATEALNRFMAWSILNTEPPIKYDRQDPFFAASGGPVIAPRELWATTGDMDTVQIGEGEPLFSAYIGLLQQYADLTGVNAPRLGAQTVSHTTAYAKNAELSRGVVRTVDYANSVMGGPMLAWLHREFEMGKSVMKGEQTFFIPAYGGFVSITKEHLPDLVDFEVFGAGGPAEERDKMGAKLSAIQLAFQIDQLKIATGGTPMNYDAIQKQILREGGWVDLDQFFAEGATGVPGAAPAGATVSPSVGLGASTPAALVG